MPSKLEYNLGMENKLTDYKAKTIYRVVTVLQAPFMMKNAAGNLLIKTSCIIYISYFL
jgi:hypothetical protein